MMTGWSLHLFRFFSDGKKAQRIDILLAIVPFKAIPECYRIMWYPWADFSDPGKIQPVDRCAEK